MNYTVSDKVLTQRKQMTNWSKRVRIFILRNQGWTFEQIGKEMGISRQYAHIQYHKVKDMDVQELEALVQKQEEI